MGPVLKSLVEFRVSNIYKEIALKTTLLFAFKFFGLLLHEGLGLGFTSTKRIWIYIVY